MEFSERLKTALKIKGKTAQQISINCGINKSLVSKYLHGSAVPKYENRSKIAKYLDISLDYLLEKSDDIFGHSIKNSKISNLPSTKKKLINGILNMCLAQDDKDLELILSVITALVKKK